MYMEFQSENEDGEHNHISTILTAGEVLFYSITQTRNKLQFFTAEKIIICR